MSKRLSLLLLILLSCTGRAAAAAKDAPQWIVVTAPAFKDALTPLCDQRRAEGMQVIVVPITDVLSAKQIRAGDAAALKKHLQKLYKQTKAPSYVLLVGAVGLGDSADANQLVVPTLRGTVGRMNGQPSDSGYGYRADEPVPTVAVGRFPARSEADVREMVRKTLAFERDRAPGSWHNRVTLLIGNPGGFTPIEKKFGESFIEGIAGTRFNLVDPQWVGRCVIHASASPFCVPDDRLREVSLRYLQEGQMFTLYLGHSSAGGFWSNNARFLDRADWGKLKIEHGPGVFFSCGCFGCQLTSRDEGYGLAALRNPGGPVAVVGAHAESYGAMGQLAADGLLDCLSRAQAPERLAEYWLAVQAGLMKGKMDALTFWLYDQADGSRGKVPLDVQRKEHLEMWMLLGDPALRLPLIHPTIRLESKDAIAAGKQIEVRGTLPRELARCTVKLTLERPTGSRSDKLQPLPTDPAAAHKVMLANQERANSTVLATYEVQPKDGKFRCTVTLPEPLPWKTLTLRATAATETKMALGVLTLPLKPANPKD